MDVIAASEATGTVIGLLAFAGIFGVLVLVPKLIGRATSAATQKIARGSHREGQSLVAGSFQFRVPVAPPELAEFLVTTVNPHPRAPAIAPGLYLRDAMPNGLRFAFGSKIGDQFVTEVAFAEAPDGTLGRFSVVSWSESGGLVAHRGELARLRDRVQVAIAGLDGQVFALTEPSQ